MSTDTSTSSCGYKLTVIAGVLGAIFTCIGVIVAVLTWLLPFGEVGPSPIGGRTATRETEDISQRELWVEEPSGKDDARSNGQEQLTGNPPDQFVRDYYAGINARNYTYTWALLSTNFKEQNHSADDKGFDAYVEWWNTIERVTVKSPNIEQWDDDLAKVCATLHYDRTDGTARNSDLCFYLIAVDTTYSWQIDRTSSR